MQWHACGYRQYITFPLLPISQGWRYDQFPLLPWAHVLQAFIPAFDDFFDAQCEPHRLLVTMSSADEQTQMHTQINLGVFKLIPVWGGDRVAKFLNLKGQVKFLNVIQRFAACSKSGVLRVRSTPGLDQQCFAAPSGCDKFYLWPCVSTCSRHCCSTVEVSNDFSGCEVALCAGSTAGTQMLFVSYSKRTPDNIPFSSHIVAKASKMISKTA